MYVVWVQPIDDDTTPKNLDDYGTVHDVAQEQADDDKGTPNKQFCDGQTSVTPPRYATDEMGGIYLRSREAADMVSDYLRGDVVRRIHAGEIAAPLPVWYSPRYVEGVMMAADAVLLKARLYVAFPQVPTGIIDAELATMTPDLDGLSVMVILRQMRRRLQS